MDEPVFLFYSTFIMRQKNIGQLKKIRAVVDVQEVRLLKQVKEKLNEHLPRAQRNDKHINVYRITYRSQGHNVIGFIVEPRKGEELPCIIYNRGGMSDFGAIKFGRLFIGLAELARQGYIVIASQYSGNSGSEGVDEYGGGDVKDVLTLYQILKAYPRADEKRVGMYGVSRGGMMTYLCLTRARWIRAAVSMSGLANLLRSAETRPEMKALYAKTFNKSVAEKKKRSAVCWPEKFPKKVPLLIMHGSADWRVSPLDSIELSHKLYEHRVPHRLVLFEGADHSLTEVSEEADRLTREWFDRFVKHRGSLPNLKPHGR